MFSKAVPLAAGFTRPVVISSRTTEGVCAASIGTYVVVNREGWILTAGHLLDIVREQQDCARRHAGYRGNVVEFQRDIATSAIARKGCGPSTGRPAPRCAITRCGGGWTAYECLLSPAVLRQPTICSAACDRCFSGGIDTSTAQIEIKSFSRIESDSLSLCPTSSAVFALQSPHLVGRHSGVSPNQNTR